MKRKYNKQNELVKIFKTKLSATFDGSTWYIALNNKNIAFQNVVNGLSNEIRAAFHRRIWRIRKKLKIENTTEN